MSKSVKLAGRCLCGAVRVAAQVPEAHFGACHCSMCRRWTGGPLLAVHCGTEVKFTGEEQIATYASSEWAERGFCRRCGTHLFYRLKQDGQYALPLGLLDEGPAWSFAEEIFIDEQPGYYEFANPTRRMTGAEAFAAFAPQED
jgi:hypothetical protein